MHDPRAPGGSEAPPGPVARFLLAGAGTGYAPAAPGTVGSLATALAVAGTAAAGGPALLVAAGLCVAGCAVTLGWGGRAVGKSGHGDPGWVVADEVAGQAMASAVALAGPVWPSAALAFVLFRLLDIVKPWPVNRAERLPGGLGVLADDLVAGAMAAAVVLGLHLVGFP